MAGDWTREGGGRTKKGNSGGSGGKIAGGGRAVGVSTNHGRDIKSTEADPWSTNNGQAGRKQTRISENIRSKK